MPDFHPLANLFPLLEGDEYAALVASIQENGLREPIALLDGAILDGRNRYRACQEAGVKPRYWNYPDSDESALRYVLDVNLVRRHMNESQRAMVAAKVATMKQGGDRRSADFKASIEALKQKDAACMLNVSRSAVQRAATVQEKGSPALQTTVESGKVPVSVAEKVARMPEPKQEDFLDRFFAQPDTPPHQIVAQMNRDETRQRILESAQTPQPELPTGQRYAVVYADPPWRYEQQSMGHTERGVENHYPTMTLEDICALPVPAMATDDAILFLWATAPCLLEALQVMKAWGFDYKSQFVWVKDRIGLGYHVRNQHELLLIGRRGNLPIPEPENRPSSVVEAPLGAHSQKPERFYELIEAMYPCLPAIELFARSKRAGWRSWGLEANP